MKFASRWWHVKPIDGTDSQMQLPEHTYVTNYQLEGGILTDIRKCSIVNIFEVVGSFLK